MSEFNLLAFSGAIHQTSTCRNLIRYISNIDQKCSVKLFDISELPHFVPGVDDDVLPEVVKSLRKEVESADALLIITPEYVFSLPALLKNAIEWGVSSTIFDGKPVGYIVAASSGEKAFEALNLILETLQARLDPACKLLLKGLKGKTNELGAINDTEVAMKVDEFYHALKASIVIK